MMGTDNSVRKKEREEKKKIKTLVSNAKGATQAMPEKNRKSPEKVPEPGTKQIARFLFLSRRVSHIDLSCITVQTPGLALCPYLDHTLFTHGLGATADTLSRADITGAVDAAAAAQEVDEVFFAFRGELAGVAGGEVRVCGVGGSRECVERCIHKM